MLSAFEEAVVADMLAETTHAVLDEDEVDLTLDVWEGKNDEEEDY